MRGASLAIAITSTLSFGVEPVMAFDFTAKNAVVGNRLQDKEVTAYVHGIGEGFAWANSFWAARKQPQLFCAPGNLSLTPEQHIDVLQRYIIRVPRDADDRVGNALLKALRETFPCQ